LSINKRGVISVLIVGVVMTLAFYYLFLGRWGTPGVVADLEDVINKGYEGRLLQSKFNEIFSKEKGLIYIVLEGMEGEKLLTVSRSHKGRDIRVIELREPLEIGALRVGFEAGAFYRNTGGTGILFFGGGLTLVMALLLYLYLRGVSDRLYLISSYLKESDLDDVDALVREEWPSEIKRVVTAIELLLKKVERSLRIKIEEAKRDKLFAHNSMVELVDCLDKVSQGDLRVRAEATPDMVGALGEAFNDAITVLEERTAEAQELVKQLEGRLQTETEETAFIKGYLDKLKKSLGYFRTLTGD